MRHLRGFIAVFSLILMQSMAVAKDDSKLADLIFPSNNQITESQLTPLTAAELKNIVNAIELPSEFCLDHIKTRIKENILDEWLTGFKKYDFSGDGIEDLLFISYCGTEELRNYLWVKKDDKYNYSGVAEGKLIKFFRTPDAKASSAVTRGGRCCLGYIGFINLYKPSGQAQGVKYSLAESVREFSQLTIPEKRTLSKRFEVRHDKYRLREHPVIDDKNDEYASDLEGTPVHGNILAEFTKGSKGLAIAEKEDETGRVWWFVIMDVDAKAEYSRFYGDQKSSKAGWMSSRFLKVIH